MKIGLIGLATMGRNLAINMLEKGIEVAAFDVDAACRNHCAQEPGLASDSFALHEDLESFIAALKPPRLVFIMIKAGDPVDRLLARAIPRLLSGDTILDGGNSHFSDTLRRCRELSRQGIVFLGAGISGGAHGARHGPAIMLGGTRVPPTLKHILETICARFDQHPCLFHTPEVAGGHFVKMIHNGIEYADMQLLAEAQSLLEHLLGLDIPEQAEVFHGWGQGELAGYLTTITARILERIDGETGRPALELIHDAVDHKGTGLWTAQIALELGVSTPNLLQGVDARLLSRMEPTRRSMRQAWPNHSGKVSADEKRQLIPALAEALLAARITVFAQGFALVDAANRQFDWNLDKKEIAACWRKGCILQGAMPERIHNALAAAPDPVHLLLDADLGSRAAQGFKLGRPVLAAAMNRELPVPGLLAALSFFDALRQAPLWTRVVAAQRDFFGAHGFQRTDRPQRDSWVWS
ncbi:MAG: NADP-dependent phosphogluconate dehydrogenase [Magnetococcales bacterium]|nr:NADP-dependent phosphogluconate dehydrogenase [Magnetococcales bacterium]